MCFASMVRLRVPKVPKVRHPAGSLAFGKGAGTLKHADELKEIAPLKHGKHKGGKGHKDHKDHETPKTHENPTVAPPALDPAGPYKWNAIGKIGGKVGTMGVIGAGAGASYLAYNRITSDSREVLKTIEDAGHKVYTNMGPPARSMFEGAKEAAMSALEVGEDAVHSIPGAISGAVHGAEDTLSGLASGNVTTIIVIGLGVFVAYEAYVTFSRS